MRAGLIALAVIVGVIMCAIIGYAYVKWRRSEELSTPEQIADTIIGDDHEDWSAVLYTEVRSMLIEAVKKGREE